MNDKVHPISTYMQTNILSHIHYLTLVNMPRVTRQVTCIFQETWDFLVLSPSLEIIFYLSLLHNSDQINHTGCRFSNIII